MTKSTHENRPAGGPRHLGRKFRVKRLKTTLPRPVPEGLPPAAKTAERVAKVIARAGLCSRREAEAWIAAGRVTVNGAVISSPALNVTALDRVGVDGKPLPAHERTRLFLFHKPRGLVTTSVDPQGRPTIYGALPKDLPRLISVGRLDLNTEGLLLLTNDGGLARALELPATGWLRRYRVRAHGRVTQAQLDGLRNGLTVDGIHYGPIEATLERAQAEQGSNVWITFAMREGKNREVRNVLRELGLQVNRLIRVSFGPFQLGDLPAGAVLEVTTKTLRDQLGSRLVALSGADFSAPIVERQTPVQRTPLHYPQAEETEGRKPRPAARSSSKERGFARDRKDGAQSGHGRPGERPHHRPSQDRGEGRRNHRKRKR